MTDKGRPEKAVKRRGRKSGRKPGARVEVTLGLNLPPDQVAFVERVGRMADVAPSVVISVLMAVIIARDE